MRDFGLHSSMNTILSCWVPKLSINYISTEGLGPKPSLLCVSFKKDPCVQFCTLLNVSPDKWAVHVMPTNGFIWFVIMKFLNALS